jgi:predicted O-linked N-acetylglucosamine transferase (SPINDLY family)
VVTPRPNIPADVQQMLRQALQHHHARQFEHAEKLYRQVLNRFPGHADAIQLLGVVHFQTQRFEESAELISRAITIAPNIADWHSNLGNALLALKRDDEAIAAFQRAVELKPDLKVAQLNLARALMRKDDPAGAADALNQRGVDAFNAGNLPLARILFRQAAETYGRCFEAHNNLASILLNDGLIDEAIGEFREALSINPDAAAVHGNICMALHYRCEDPQQIFDEHVRWGQQHGSKFADHARAHKNDRNPDRRLRIGYISPDFREHSVAYFVSPIIESHDRSQFELFLYDTGDLPPDSVTEWFKNRVDSFRRITDESDDRAAEIIRDDRIDILVDLAGHTHGNRLLVFARKPAPVQVTYQGYPDTSGLPAIDYRITDAIADPLGVTDRFNVEKLIRLPETNWCYRPSPDAPPVAELPMRQNNFVTFASFNNFAKVSPKMLELWAQLLLCLPNSKLLLKASGLDNPDARQRTLATLTSESVNADRIELVGRTRSTIDHLALYGRCDVALDTYPYNGTTTTCEALWMGVPVVTLCAPDLHMARVSASLLTTAGLPELIATSPQQYIDIAAALASDPNRLLQLRTSMRERLHASPLLDGPRFTRNLEAMYRQLWKSWCAS